MSPLSVEEQAVAKASAPVQKESSEFIKETVRFWFHGLGISLCGILALLIPDLVALPLLLFAVGLFAWYEFLRCRTWLQPYVSHWPLMLWRKRKHWAESHSNTGVLRKVLVYSSGAGLLLVFAAALPLFLFSFWHPAVARAIKVRPHEVGTRASSLDYLVGFTIAWAICPTYIMATACFVTAWCDPMARTIGQRWGKHKWWFSKKTVEGSIACSVVATVVAYTSLAILGSMPREIALAGSVLTGIAAATVELIPQFPRDPKPGDVLSPADNFSIILTASLVLTGWHHFFCQTPTLF